MIYYLILINICAFIMFGIDKKNSKLNKYRIREKTLLFVALVGGCLGSLFGMFFYHHKNRKTKFLIIIPFICVIWILILTYYTEV